MSAVPAPVELVPPPDPKAVLRVGLIGLGLSAVAAVLGAVTPDDGPAVLNTIRLLPVAVGAVVAGSAISMRPGMWQAWAVAAGTALLAALLGVPEHWDSARLLGRALAGLAAGGAALVAMKPIVRYSVVTALVVFHFG